MDPLTRPPVPVRAFVLAAGFGTRLLPLTRVAPKPLLPLRGVPMLERALALVRSWGVRDVLVNVHHQAEAMIRHLLQRKPDGLRIQISFEPDILGTGGALVRASWFFADGRPFWLLNADVAARVDPAPLQKSFSAPDTIAAAWLMASRGPRTVACQNGVITDFAVPHPGAAHTYTFCGLHLVNPAVLRYLPPSGFASIIDAYRAAMKSGWRVAGVPIENAYWADIGTPEQYVRAEAELSPEPAAPRTLQDVRVSAAQNMIYGPGVPDKPYDGIMALRARDALDPHELNLARTWAKGKTDLIACPLAPRGSARSFTRLVAGKATAMLVQHQPDREENNLYAGHTRFLAALGLPVPRVLAEDLAHHLTLYEDVGRTSVQDQAPHWNVARLSKLYEKVLASLVVFHEEGYRVSRRKKLSLMRPFDDRLYAYEHDLFLHEFLRDRMGVAASALGRIRRELLMVSAPLRRVRSVLVHRDLQSSNLLLKGRRWYFIDYQGMRYGPAAYDLASLLCDAYITIDHPTREQLLEHYARIADPRSRVRELFPFAAVQRLGQALGAFARLSKQPGTRRFAAYIQPALHYLSDILQALPGLPALSENVHELKSRTGA